MSFLGKFPYLSQCCIWISLRSGCMLIGLFSLVFHLIFFMIRDIVIVAFMRQALEKTNTSAYALLSLLVIQTIFMRLPGIVISISIVFGALMHSIFIVRLCVWTNFYVLTLMAVGVILSIAQLFYPGAEYFVAIILFDLLLFVFLNYFFLIINSYYHYLIQMKNVEREAVYATLRRGGNPAMDRIHFDPS